MRGQLVRFIPLQIVYNDNSPIRFVSILSQLGPSDLGAIIAEDWGMGGTVFPGGDLLAVLTLEIDDVDLDIQSDTKNEARTGPLTHVLLGVPCRRQVGVQRGIHDVGLGDIEVVRPSKWFDGSALQSFRGPVS